MPIQRFKVTPTITAGAYSAGDVIGGRLEFKGVRPCRLQSITITDNAAQNMIYELVFFESQPTDIADNAAFAVAAADLAKIIYHETLGTSDRFPTGSRSYHFRWGLDVPISPLGSSLWAFLAVTGAPTYVATGDITVTIQVEQG